MKILHTIGKVVNACVDYSTRVRAVAELSQLSDRQLEDIGIARYELNVKLTDMWTKDEVVAPESVAPKADTDKTALVDAVKQPEKEKGLGMQLVSMYSTWNRPDYIV